MSNYWHWSLGMIGAAVSIILYGHKVPAIISPTHFAVIASWLTIGYGLLGWGLVFLLARGYAVWLRVKNNNFLHAAPELKMLRVSIS